MIAMNYKKWKSSIEIMLGLMDLDITLLVLGIFIPIVNSATSIKEIFWKVGEGEPTKYYDYEVVDLKRSCDAVRAS